jgi:hypothetical protein
MGKREKRKRIVRKKEFPGYPSYGSSEDIYSRQREEPDLDPENPKQVKAPNEKPDTMNEKNFNQDVSGSDLDIPGTEMDDVQEAIGSEDEENNHYSLGGDNHESQEENTGGKP